MRFIEVRMYGGLHFRLLPDRGLDISSAWHGDMPLSWQSRLGETPPLAVLREVDWLKGFGGGLLVTCGMQNVGAASEGHGVHGAFSHQSARDVTWRRELRGDDLVIEISGVIPEIDPLGTQLVCERRIATATGTPTVTVSDTVTNVGGRLSPAPWLYHINVGAPLWSEGASVQISSREQVVRDKTMAHAAANWAIHMVAEPDCSEMAIEHVLEEGIPARARVSNPRMGVDLVIEWDRSTLPRLHQWLHRAAGINALGIEPANCSLFGRGADRSAGRLPVLRRGEQRTTSVSIAAVSSDSG
jgi:hypothetical protein